MEFNIEDILTDMLSAMKDVIAGHWKDVESVTTEFLNRKKERLELLAQLRIEGAISQMLFISRLEDEKLILEAELNALAVLSKAIIQKAVNAAIDTLLVAVNKIISAIL